MNEHLPLIKQHIVRSVTIGWFLGCLCIYLPIGIALVFISMATENSNFGFSDLALMLLLLLPQGFLLGIVVRVGLSLFQVVTERSRQTTSPLES